MDNQSKDQFRITKPRAVVRWQDGTHDNHRVCTDCSKLDCKCPVYPDSYREIVTKKSYIDWMEENGRRNEDDELAELPTANPDVLSQGVEAFFAGEEDLSVEHDILTAAVGTLTDAQKRVWDLCMKENPVTHEIAAKMLGISRSAVTQHLQAAVKKVEKYCKNFSREN